MSARPRLSITPTEGQRQRVDAFRAKIGTPQPAPAPRPSVARKPANDDRQSIGEILDSTIDRLMKTAPLSASARICLEGNTMHIEGGFAGWGGVEGVEIASESDHPHTQPVEVGFRAVQTSPLEALFHSKRNPLELYQYLAGCRFRMDWHLSQISPLGAVDYARGAMYVTEAMQRHAADGYVPGIDGPALASALQGVKATPEHKIDAMARVGAALKNLAKDRAWLARKWVGEEWPIVACARHLGCDERVVNWSVRRMLDELAQHYRLASIARHG